MPVGCTIYIILQVCPFFLLRWLETETAGYCLRKVYFILYHVVFGILQKPSIRVLALVRYSRPMADTMLFMLLPPCAAMRSRVRCIYFYDFKMYVLLLVQTDLVGCTYTKYAFELVPAS